MRSEVAMELLTASPTWRGAWIRSAGRLDDLQATCARIEKKINRRAKKRKKGKQTNDDRAWFTVLGIFLLFVGALALLDGWTHL